MEYILVGSENIIFRGEALSLVTINGEKLSGILSDINKESCSIYTIKHGYVHIRFNEVRECDGIVRTEDNDDSFIISSLVRK